MGSSRLTDEEIQKLILKAESPYGFNEKHAREAMMNIREVNVDEELGNVRETLLRNLNNKALAQLSAQSLPKNNRGPQDKLAKQKHQISYLAAQALSREDQIKEQWANNKEKRMYNSKRYGFR